MRSGRVGVDPNRMWYNLMPELEQPKFGVETEDDLVRKVDQSEHVLPVLPYQIGGRSPKVIQHKGLAIVLHSSASMSKFHAEVSGLDIFRLPLTISIESTTAFFSKLLQRGFHDVIVLMPDGEVWPDYKQLSSHETPGIHVVDTKTCGLGLGMILNEMSKKLTSNSELGHEKAWIDPIISNLRHWVILFNHNRIEKKEWLKQYAYRAFNKDRNLCVIVNDERPNDGVWVSTLTDSFAYIKNEIEKVMQDPQIKQYSRMVIVHESPYKDDVVSFAYELRKLSTTIPILVRHHAPRQKPFFGRHISIAII